MNKGIESKLMAWLRGFIGAAMVAGCAVASAQSYLVQPASGHYRVVTMAPGEGIALSQGTGAEGGQSSAPLPKDDLFTGTEVFAKGASNITEITMDPDSLNMVGGPDGRRAHNMVLNVVRTYQYDKPGMYNMADVDAIRSKLNTGDWHCSVHVRDLKNGSGSDVCNKRRSDGMKESAIIEVEPKQLTFIHTIRRGEGPGTSDLGYFPMMPGLSPMTMMAMINPDAFADMQMGIHGFPLMLNVDPTIRLRMQDLRGQMKDLKAKPFVDKDQMRKLQDQMKDLQKDFYKNREPKAPAPPAVPQAAPAPQAPLPPQ